MATAGRNMARELKRDVRILQYKVEDLRFFTEDFRENSLQINARVMANLDIFNMEFKRMSANKQKIEALETKVDGLQTTIQNLLGFLGIEERQRQEVLFVSHRGAAAVPKMRDVEVQVAGDVETEGRVQVEKKDAIVQTTVTESRDTGIQCSITSADASVQTAPMATPNVEAGRGASAAASPHGSAVTQYPPATPRMRAEEGKLDELWYPTLLCSDDGRVEWQPPADEWINFKREGYELYFPDIILPSMLGGGKVWIGLDDTGRVVQLQTGMLNDAYNKLETQLPVRGQVGLKMIHSTSNVQVCAWEGDVTWKDYSWFDVCDLDRDMVMGTASPKFQLRFTKPH